MKMSISIPDALADELQRYCEQSGMKKSTTLQIALRQYLDVNKIADELYKDEGFLEAMKNIAKKQGGIEQ